MGCQGRGKTRTREGKEKAQKRVQEAHTGVIRLAALQPKQIPAGYNVAEFSKD